MGLDQYFTIPDCPHYGPHTGPRGPFHHRVVVRWTGGRECGTKGRWVDSAGDTIVLEAKRVELGEKWALKANITKRSWKEGELQEGGSGKGGLAVPADLNHFHCPGSHHSYYRVGVLAG